jgi:uncharacterized membrane protein YraQ (UPF0718 family)
MTTIRATSPPSFGDAKSKSRHLEIALALLLAVAIAATFWGGQRYPSLLKKLHAGQSLKVAGAISFDALLPVAPTMPLAERVGRTAVNWLWTNRFGMYFAIPFGAAMMTLLARTTRTKRFDQAAANICFGAVAGAPMGVCSNCATPIGQSLLVSGASTRMTVAAMISSPSFNPVVIVMVYVLFPPWMAAARILVPLLMLLALPLLVPEPLPALKTIDIPDLSEKLGNPIAAVVVDFLKNLLRVTLLTLPWMLLASLLGALAAETIPAYGTHLSVSVFGVILVAIFGTLLPVPMAFDAGLAWVLYHAGVPPAYVATLLCTLGVVSVYSLTALGKQLGWQTSLRLGGAAAVLGSIVGVVARWM